MAIRAHYYSRLVWQKLIPRRGGSLFRKRNIELHTHQQSFASFVETIRDSVRNANIPSARTRSNSIRPLTYFEPRPSDSSMGNRISTPMISKKKNKLDRVQKLLNISLGKRCARLKVKHSVSFDLRFSKKSSIGSIIKFLADV